jgi:hypothetical protein
MVYSVIIIEKQTKQLKSTSAIHPSTMFNKFNYDSLNSTGSFSFYENI